MVDVDGGGVSEDLSSEFVGGVRSGGCRLGIWFCSVGFLLQRRRGAEGEPGRFGGLEFEANRRFEMVVDGMGGGSGDDFAVADEFELMEVGTTAGGTNTGEAGGVREIEGFADVGGGKRGIV